MPARKFALKLELFAEEEPPPVRLSPEDVPADLRTHAASALRNSSDVSALMSFTDNFAERFPDSPGLLFLRYVQDLVRLEDTNDLIEDLYTGTTYGGSTHYGDWDVGHLPPHAQEACLHDELFVFKPKDHKNPDFLPSYFSPPPFGRDWVRLTPRGLSKTWTNRRGRTLSRRLHPNVIMNLSPEDVVGAFSPHDLGHLVAGVWWFQKQRDKEHAASLERIEAQKTEPREDQG